MCSASDAFVAACCLCIIMSWPKGHVKKSRGFVLVPSVLALADESCAKGHNTKGKKSFHLEL